MHDVSLVVAEHDVEATAAVDDWVVDNASIGHNETDSVICQPQSHHITQVGNNSTGENNIDIRFTL